MAIEIAGITELLIYAAIMCIGAVLAVVFPYILNKWLDPEEKVNWIYVAVLIFSILVAVLFALPDTVDIINLSAIKTALLSGYGLQAFIGKVIATVLEKKKENGST